MVAYDYEAQKWVEGDAAVALRAKQDREAAELEKNPAFQAFVSKWRSEPDVGEELCVGCGNRPAGHKGFCARCS